MQRTLIVSLDDNYFKLKIPLLLLVPMAVIYTRTCRFHCITCTVVHVHIIHWSPQVHVHVYITHIYVVHTGGSGGPSVLYRTGSDNEEDDITSLDESSDDSDLPAVTPSLEATPTPGEEEEEKQDEEQEERHEEEEEEERDEGICTCMLLHVHVPVPNYIELRVYVHIYL